MSLTPSKKACLSVSRRLCPKERGDLLESERDDLLNHGEEQNVANAQIRILLDRQKERILAECRAEIKKHEFQADYRKMKCAKIW